jgi:hypothetical protein
MPRPRPRTPKVIADNSQYFATKTDEDRHRKVILVNYFTVDFYYRVATFQARYDLGSRQWAKGERR